MMLYLDLCIVGFGMVIKILLIIALSFFSLPVLSSHASSSLNTFPIISTIQILSSEFPRRLPLRAAGREKAAVWIADPLRVYRLQPAVADTSFLQLFTLTAAL
jgi:hypothetical protein